VKIPNYEPTTWDCDWRGKWLVLRCANKNTTALASGLAIKGLRAWTPMWVRRVRYPRSNNARSLTLPCLPSFVFLAEADAVRALDAAQAMLVPGFSVMKSYGMVVRIKDNDLQTLRDISDTTPRKDDKVLWPDIGSEQKIISGAFQGLVGKVVGRTNRHCLVEINDQQFPVVKIPPFLLEIFKAE